MNPVGSEELLEIIYSGSEDGLEPGRHRIALPNICPKTQLECPIEQRRRIMTAVRVMLIGALLWALAFILSAFVLRGTCPRRLDRRIPPGRMDRLLFDLGSEVGPRQDLR